MIGKLALLALLALTDAYPSTRHNLGSVFTEPHDLCPPSRHHYLLPHEYDCSKFYYCEYGQKWIAPRDCAPGTVFAYELQVCVHPRDAGCTLPGFPFGPPTEDGEHLEGPGSAPEPPTVDPEQPEVEAKPESEEVVQPEPESEEKPESLEVTPEIETPEPEVEAKPESEEVVQPEPESEEKPESLEVTPEVETPEPEVEAKPESEEVVQPEPESEEKPESLEVAPEVETPEPKPEVEAKPESQEVLKPESEESEITPEESSEVIEQETSSPDVLPNGCPADWGVHKLLRHETECNLFYYCNFGQKVLRQCAPGTVFNYNIQVCDWPQNVDCSAGNGNGGGNGNNVPQPKPEVEEKPDSIEVQPESTTEVETPEPKPEVEEKPESEEVVQPEPESEEKPESEEVVKPESEESEITPEESTEVIDQGTNSPDASLLPNGCPADWGVHKLLPHETQCNLFYYCNFGEKVLRQCAPGTVFNYKIQVCDWPQNVDCSAGNGNGGGNGNNVPQPKPEEKPDSIEVEPESTPEVETLEPKPEVEAKPESEEVDQASPEVVTPESEEKPDLETTPEEKPESAEENSNGGNSGNSVEDNGNSGVLPNGCPSDWNIHQLLPHESSCNKFYYCVHGNLVERDCSGGLHFNPALQVCDWPSNAGCQVGGNGNGAGENNVSEESNANSSGDDNENSSETGNNTDGGNTGASEESKPDTETGNSQETNANTSEESANSSEIETNVTSEETGNSGESDNSGESGNSGEAGVLANGCPADWNVHLLMPHESECGKFYYCVHGNLVERECSGGLHFNPALQVCDWPATVGCQGAIDNGNSGEDGNGSDENGNESSEAGSGSGGNGNGSNEDGNGSNEIGNGGSESGNSTEEVAIEPDHSKCADCNIGYWAHETDCDKFWRCEGDKAILGICAEGLHFNAKTKTCDFMCNANCSREYVTETFEKDGTRLFVPWSQLDKNSMKKFYRDLKYLQ